MKLIKKTLLFLVLIGMAMYCECNPEYETPMIFKKDQPFNQPVNPRLDNINDSSANNYKRYISRKLKIHLNNDLGRSFNLENYKKWLSFYENEDLKERTIGEMVENVGNILTKSIDLQNYINFKSGLVVKELALLDMKLKQIEALETAIENVKLDSGNKLDSDYLLKQELDDVTLESASIDSNYNLGWSTICEVLDLQDDVTNKVKSNALKSIKKISASEPAPRNVVDLKKGQKAIKKEKKNKKAKKENYKKGKIIEIVQVKPKPKEIHTINMIERSTKHKSHKNKSNSKNESRRHH